MPKFRDRICVKCGKVERSATRADTCLSCYWQDRTARKVSAEKQRIFNCYGNVEGPIIDKFGHRCYTFTHTCGTTQTWAFTNLLRCWGRPHVKEPCKKCGGQERVKKAMAGYVAKFQLSERARTDLRAYTRKVRGLSEKTYRDNIETLNPQRLKRGRGNQGHHLDHIISIVECFKRGWPPEQAAALDNLQLLEAGANLSKGRAPASGRALPHK